MYVHGEREISAGHPYGATLAIGDGSDDDTTDVWVRITPSFIPSSELYDLNDIIGLAIVHHASTLSATLLHLTVEEKKPLKVTDETSRLAIIYEAVHSILMTLNGIENGIWSDI